MAMTHILEFSRDPLSDITPTWTNITNYLLDVPECSVGVDGDLQDPQPGTATFRLDNRDRRFEFGYVAGAYYPDIKPLRRIRWRIDDGAVTHDMFYGFVVDWGPSWPGGMNQEALVKCVDGSMVLELDRPDFLSPMTAVAYEEVVMHDEPFAYYKLGEKAGTKMEPATGPEGVYFNTPTFGGIPLIVGESETSVEFAGASSEYGRVPLADVGQFADTNKLTLEAWVRPTDVGVDWHFMGGPHNTGHGDSNCFLQLDGGQWSFSIAMTNPLLDVGVGSGVVASTSNTDHVVGTYDGQTARIYINGVLEGEAFSGGTVLQGSASQFLYVGRSGIGGSLYARALMKHAAFYEKALSAARIAARYDAGVNGFAEQTAGERITALVASDLWTETAIQTGAHMVQPAMSHGQSRVEEVAAAVRAECPSSLFFFKGNGDPRYLGWDHGDTSPYNTVQATFGHNASEVPFEDITIVADDEMFNEVTVTHQSTEDGETSHTESDAASILEYRRRTHAENVILVHHDDAIAVAATILAEHKDPQNRVANLRLTSVNTDAQAQILTRLPGDRIRVKHRPKGGTAIDLVTVIRGRKLRLNPADDSGSARVLECDWSLARGFDAAPGTWRLGIIGFTELNSTAVLA